MATAGVRTGSTGAFLVGGFDIHNMGAVEIGERKERPFGKNEFSRSTMKLQDVDHSNLSSQVPIIANRLIHDGAPWADDCEIVVYADQGLKRSELHYQGRRYRCHACKIESKKLNSK